MKLVWRSPSRRTHRNKNNKNNKMTLTTVMMMMMMIMMKTINRKFEIVFGRCRSILLPLFYWRFQCLFLKSHRRFGDNYFHCHSSNTMTTTRKFTSGRRKNIIKAARDDGQTRTRTRTTPLRREIIERKKKTPTSPFPSSTIINYFIPSRMVIWQPVQFIGLWRYSYG